MSDFKGTAGEWLAIDKRHINGGFSIFGESQYVAFVGDTDGKTNAYANANLIAAAPELLEALQELFADYKQLADSGDAGFWKLEDTNVGKKSLAAIAKALGQTQ